MTNAMCVLTLICFLFICFIFVLVFCLDVVFFWGRCFGVWLFFIFIFTFLNVLFCFLVFCFRQTLFFILNDCDKTALDWMLRPGLIEQKTPFGFHRNSYICEWSALPRYSPYQLWAKWHPGCLGRRNNNSTDLKRKKTCWHSENHQLWYHPLVLVRSRHFVVFI